MAKQEKVPGKVKKESDKKFKVEKDKASEVDIDIDMLVDGNYEVDKLRLDGLPTEFPQPDGKSILIVWYNNFSIKLNSQYVKQAYKVKIPGVSKRGDQILVVYDNTNGLSEYKGSIVDDTIELNDGDPGIGHAP
jgi:hypothetical protein